MTSAPARAVLGKGAERMSILGFAVVEESGLPLEALAWRCFRDAVGETLFDTSAVVMASCDALDARGISCMAVSGMLASVADEQTRVGDAAWAMLLAAALLGGRHDRVAVLAWEKPEDFQSGLTAMSGDPNYQRPIGWTAGIEGSLLRSMASGTARVETEVRHASDRAACLVLGREDAIPGAGGISITCSLRRGLPPRDASSGGHDSLDMPVASPVEPLVRIISEISSLGRRGEGQSRLLIPTADQCHFDMTVSHA